jgi:hypothetical protein
VLSHDLARLLLARRNNDIKFLVGVDADPDGLEEVQWCMVEMEDDRQRVVSGRQVPPEEVLTFNSQDDYLQIQLGVIYLGDPPDYPKGLCANREDHGPHLVKEGSLAPYWCTADQSKREPFASGAAQG